MLPLGGPQSGDLTLSPSCGQFWAEDFGDGAVEGELGSERDWAPFPHIHFTAQETVVLKLNNLQSHNLKGYSLALESLITHDIM